MFVRFAFAGGAVVLILVAAGCPSRADEEQRPQTAVPQARESYALPGSSVIRSKEGDILAIRLYKPDDAMLARVFTECPRLKSLSIIDGTFTERAFRGTEDLQHFEELILIHGHLQFTGKSLADVAKVPALKGLTIQRTNIGDDDLVHLEKHPQLVELKIGNTNVSDAGIERIARFCPHLEELDVQYLPLTCRSGRAIAQLKKLENLNIGNTSIGVGGLAALATLPDLRQLSLPKIATDRGMQEVGKMKSLRTLFIYYAKVTDAGTAHMAGLTNLEFLRLICHEELTDDCLVHLGRLKSLKHLELTSNRIEGHGLIHLNELSDLDYLDIDGYRLQAEHLSRIAAHKSLRCLGTGHTSFVTPEDIEVLKQFKSLGSLEAALSLGQVEELKQALPHCSIYAE